MWNLKAPMSSLDTNELIYRQKHTHRHGKQTDGYQRGKGGWGQIRSLRLMHVPQYSLQQYSQ